MKHFVLLLSILFTLSYGAIAQCNEFYQFREGQKMTYISYDKKDKMTSKDVQEVTSFRETGDGFEITLTSTMYDKKNEETLSTEIEGECNNGVYQFDLRAFLNNGVLQSFEGMDLSIEGEPLKIPNNLTVGQELPSGDCTVKASSGGTPIMTITISMEDRKVTGKETVTTEAGTFDCYIIEQTVETKSIVSQTYHNKEFVTKKYGPVRVETYNNNGKMISRRDLTAVD